MQNQNTKLIPNPAKNAFQVVGIPAKTDVKAENIISTNNTNKFFLIVISFLFDKTKIRRIFLFSKSFCNYFTGIFSLELITRYQRLA